MSNETYLEGNYFYNIVIGLLLYHGNTVTITNNYVMNDMHTYSFAFNLGPTNATLISNVVHNHCMVSSSAEHVYVANNYNSGCTNTAIELLGARTYTVIENKVL